jgi:hypothetical protein
MGGLSIPCDSLDMNPLREAADLATMLRLYLP